MNQPAALICGHSSCRACMLTLIRSGGNQPIKCPLCRMLIADCDFCASIVVSSVLTKVPHGLDNPNRRKRITRVALSLYKVANMVALVPSIEDHYKTILLYAPTSKYHARIALENSLAFALKVTRKAALKNRNHVL